MEWSPQQDAALKAVGAWLKLPHAPQIFRLFGFAGSGKTTLAQEIAGMAGSALYAAFTGKAALVLQRKGCAGASTIHSLIYKAKDDALGGVYFTLNPDSPVASAGLVIIDECSMVGEELARALLSFGTRVLVLGDPAQLPPVSKGENRDGLGFFTEGHTPDVMLTEIHRQAAGNPIIAMATTVRTGGKLKLGDYGESRVIPRSHLSQRMVTEGGQMLVGMNKTRRANNQKIRKLKGFTGNLPQVGERLVCLRNKRDKGLLNGGLWDVKELPVSTSHRCVRMDVASEDDAGFVVETMVPVNFFLGTEDQLEPKFRRAMDEFDFGYALTCHKAQGSQWDRVLVIDESFVFKEDRDRWLYTAITRAAERITIVQD